MLTSTYLPLVGGVEMVVHNLATALTNLGHNVYVVTHYNKNKDFQEPCNYQIIRYGFRGYGRLKLNFPLVLLTLAFVVFHFKIDVINIHNVYEPGIWAYYFWKIYKKIPIVGTPHGDDIQITPEIKDGVRLNPKLDKIVRRNLEILTRITSISASIREDLNQIVSKHEKICDVPNGVWVNKFQISVDKDEMREKLHVPINSTLIISVGRNHPRKGFVYGLDALVHLKDEGIKPKYIFLGRNMESIIERAKLLGVQDCIIAPGEVNAKEVSEYLNISDIYISTAIVESFGLATLEAMSAGLPCIVTNVDGNRDLVSNDIGVLVEPSNSIDLANAIKYLINNPLVRKKMSESARIVAKAYDWPKIAEMYLDVYREATDSMDNYC